MAFLVQRLKVHLASLNQFEIRLNQIAHCGTEVSKQLKENHSSYKTNKQEDPENFIFKY
jgi:hypothetical protein